MTTILLVEDNDSLGSVLSERLAKEGYLVFWVRTCGEAREKLRTQAMSLAILDVGLPDGDGFVLAREIGGIGGVPIVFLTAMGSAESRLQGFELGAVDYIPKPFHLRELLLRIRRVLKDAPTTSHRVTPDCRFEPESFTALFADGTRVSLQPREYRLLELLISAAPRALGRQEIIDALWERSEGANARSVDNLITKIRQSIPPAYGDRIRSVRGVGYQWQ